MDDILGDLIGVVAVAKTRVRNEVRISILSIYLYKGGFELRLIICRDGGNKPDLKPGDIVRIAANVRDSIGNVYNDWAPIQGVGTGRVWIFNQKFVPSLPSDITELYITFESVKWLFANYEARSAELAGEELGPWAFIVPIAATVALSDIQQMD